MVVTQKMQDASADLEKAAAEANRVGATPQCFLIDFLDEFIKLRRVMPRGNAEYSGDPANYVCVIPPTETGTTFTSRLNSPNLQYLLEGVPKALMAELQPVVRLYKVMYNPSGPPPPTPPREHKPREEILVPLPLGNFVDPSRAFNYPGHTHSGHLAANLQTFTFDYEGVNPAEVDFFLRCKMSLEFNTPDAFFHEYTLKHNNKIFKASFSDLVKRPVINDNNDHLRYGHDMFRIKIELFYPDPGEHWFGKLAHLTPIHKEKLKQAIAASRATFFLNIIKHEFKFNTEVPSSPFVLDIEYIGSVESSLRTNHTSVISLHDWNFHDEMQEDRDRGEESIIKRYEAKLADLDTMGAGAFTDMERSDVFQMATDGNTAVRHVSTGQAYLNEGQWLGYTSVHGWRKPITEGDLVFEYTPPEVGHTDNSDASEIYSAAFARKIIREGRSTEKEMWAAYNVQYSADRAKIVEDFFEVRQKYMNFLKEIKGDIGELRASAYGKLMRRLWGQSFHAGSLEQDTGRSVAGHRNQMVHQITIPLKSAIAWQAKREQATDAEDKHFKEQWKQAEKEGDKITINRLKLERSRKQLSTKNFYKNFWRQHVFSSLATEAENMRSLADQTRQAGEGQTLRGSTREERKKLEGEGHGAALRAAGSGGQGTIQGYTLARASKSGNHLDLTKEQWEKLLKVKNNAPGTAFHHLRTTIKEGETVATDVLTSGTWAVEFVYFGDLVNSVIDLARGNASWREVELDLFTSWNGGGSSSNTIKKRGRLHVVLGTLTYKDWVTGKQKIVSLDEIPIELGLIQEFWIKHVVKPFKDNYPLRQCLRDMMTDLIANVISGTCRSPGEPTSKIMPVLEHISVASKAPMQIVINPRMTQEMREVVGEDLASAMDAGDLSIPARHAQREQYLEAEARGDVAKMDEINQKRDAIRRQVGLVRAQKTHLACLVVSILLCMLRKLTQSIFVVLRGKIISKVLFILTLAAKEYPLKIFLSQKQTFHFTWKQKVKPRA